MPQQKNLLRVESYLYKRTNREALKLCKDINMFYTYVFTSIRRKFYIIFRKLRIYF